jgi:hypothetical protein
MNWVNALSYLLGLVGLVVCLFLVGKLYESGRDAYSIISAVGSTASFFALFIAILQIIYLRRVSLAIKEAVDETKRKLVVAISLSDVARATKLIEEVQSHAGSQKYEVARLRLQDLRALLVQFGRAESLKEIRAAEEYEQHLIDVNIDISNLYSVMIGKRKNFKVLKMNENLEGIATILMKFENFLKYEQEP